MPPPRYPPLRPGAAGGAKPSFLPGWALLAAVPFAFVQAVVGFRLADGGGNTDRAIGEGFGRAMWGVALAALVAWVVWRATSRPRRVAPVVFLAVYAFLTLGTLSSLLPVGARAAATRNATDFVRGTQATAKTAAGEWAAAGGFELKTVKTPEDLRRRIERLDALVTALRNVREAPAMARERLRRDLGVSEDSEAELDRQLAQWAAGLKVESDVQVASAFEKLLLAARQQFVLLQQEWGRWRFDPSADAVVFDDARAAARYGHQAAEVAAAESQFREAARRAKAGASH
jgi:hypothetical protein